MPGQELDTILGPLSSEADLQVGLAGALMLLVGHVVGAKGDDRHLSI